jgi:hypothetical protein
MFRSEQPSDATSFLRISKHAYEHGRMEEIRKLATQPFSVSHAQHRDAYNQLDKFLNQLVTPMGQNLGQEHEKVVFVHVPRRLLFSVCRHRAV